MLLMFFSALLSPELCKAQYEPNDVPLGDIARSYRVRKAPGRDVVIDNDNFSKLVEDAEKKKTSGSTMVFSLDPSSGNKFQVSSPDVSCNFSFSAKTSSLLSDQALIDELPRSELAKLDGPAVIDGDALQVAVRNGSEWQLREVVIGLTILRRTESPAASQAPARTLPAPGSSLETRGKSWAEKQPDDTVLLKVKGSAAPSATALFRTQLNFALFPDQEWHWAIVRARGIPPPPVPAEAAAISLPAY